MRDYKWQTVSDLTAISRQWHVKDDHAGTWCDLSDNSVYSLNLQTKLTCFCLILSWNDVFVGKRLKSHSFPLIQCFYFPTEKKLKIPINNVVFSVLNCRIVVYCVTRHIKIYVIILALWQKWSHTYYNHDNSKWKFQSKLPI